MTERALHEEIDGIAFRSGLSQTSIPIPEYISSNLRHKMFDWQEGALKNFIVSQIIQKNNNTREYSHLMFNMATGTGKTLIMAALILYYYKEHKRKHFLFLVNQNNIVAKTENNFVDVYHNKYLFKEKIIIDDKEVNIQKVDAFSSSPTNIEIRFTTIQKLHKEVYTERENINTLAELQSIDLVILADEAHHLNVDTKSANYTDTLLEESLSGRSSAMSVERKGWEHMIVEMLLKKNHANYLMEFTATIPDNKNVIAKYLPKTIYDFKLKEFLSRGYTKQINLISSTLDKKERILHAILFQWYRSQLALKHSIRNFKPVILFRSKTIEESWKDYYYFKEIVDSLSKDNFDFMEKITDKLTKGQQSIFQDSRSKTEKLFQYMDNNNINYSMVCDWIKNNYQSRNIIITNSKGNNKSEHSDDQQKKLLNSLEDKNNYIRAIFTVKQLTEGWDVLNLFDIVRLYKGQNAGGSTKKTPKATVEEMQLIGRGVRYFPFPYDDKPVNCRKFDNELNHELRFLEELFYYTYDEESLYISHIKKALEEEGYIDDGKEKLEFDFNEDFKNNNFYKNGIIFYNLPEINPEGHIKKIEEIDIHNVRLNISTGYAEEAAFSDNGNKVKEVTKELISCNLLEVENHIFMKAINIKAKEDNSFYRFENISERLDIETLDELQSKYFSDASRYRITFEVDEDVKYEDIPPKYKLQACLLSLNTIERELKEVPSKLGGEFIMGPFSDFFKDPKVKLIDRKVIENSKQLWQDHLADAKWYPLNNFAGTSEEIALINFIKDQISEHKLDKEMEDFYLIRNEEIYKIYDFEMGEGFCPDFLLFFKLKDKEKKKGKKKLDVVYQVFIEPKSERSLFEGKVVGEEKRKATFLKQISERYGDRKDILKFSNKSYRLVGLPFYSNVSKEFNNQFRSEFNNILSIKLMKEKSS